jgi:hypothetical protein
MIEYEYCRKYTGYKALPPQAANVLIRSNSFEDLAIWVKAFNWHFYHPEKMLGGGSLGLGQGSLWKRFQKLEKRAQMKKSLYALGGLIHYIQDVTNPAHVAPVFHTARDSFDNYPFEISEFEAIEEENCQKLKSSARVEHTYSGLLKTVSSETLQRLEDSFELKVDGVLISSTWKEEF